MIVLRAANFYKMPENETVTRCRLGERCTVSINPLHSAPGHVLIAQVTHSTALHSTAQHCNVVQVEEVWRRAVVSRQPQSLVLTGRSGSGKTCNFKQALAHLVETTQPSAGECPLSGARLAAADCLLESFCSTRTSLNTHARYCIV